MTSPERWSEIQRVLDGALDLSSETRTTFVTDSCGADSDLHEQVLRLLKACERAEQRESLLATPAAELALPMIADLGADAECRRSAMMDTLKAALSQQYDVQRVIGLGGMSTVFLAHDIRHDRDVAVKVLERDVLAPGSVERFLKEIRVTARLNHPHTLPVHDSGEVEGLLYYVTPYVDGETLRTRLHSGNALALPEILRLLREMADALAFAHARGVVHRDLKPENVLLSGGHAVVGDFGIAQALTDAAGTRTETGAPSIMLGTPAYMAPEQADGTLATDHRCDLYAFGLVAYELLAGAHPFSGRSPREMVRAQLEETPAPLDTIRPDLPTPLVSLVMQCLAKSPAGRPHTATDLLAQLDESLRQFGSRRRPRRRRAVMAGLSAAGVLVVSAAAWLAFRPARSLLASGALVERQPLVVADFRVGGADSGVGQTLGRMLTRYLGESRVITVMSRSQIDSVLRLMRRSQGTPLDPTLAREVAQRSGIRAVVTGDLQRLGPGYLVTVRLVSANTGDELAYFHRSAADDDAIIPVIGRLGRDLRRRIGESLREVSAGPPLRALTTESFAALRMLSAFTSETDFERRLALLRGAIALDSMFAYAYLVLANHLSAVRHSSAMKDSALARAYLLRDHLTQSEQTFATAWYWSRPGGDRTRVITAYDVQVARDSTDWRTILNLGLALNNVRRFARTESLMRRYEGAVSWRGFMNLALAEVGQGRVDAADSTIDRFDARPDLSDVFELQTRVAVALATLQLDSAAVFTKRWRAIPPANATPPFETLIALARARGRLDEARTLASQAEGLSIAAGIPASGLAETLAAAGDDLWLRGHAAAARRRLDESFGNRPIAPLNTLDDKMDHLRAAALYAASGRPDRAGSILAAVMTTPDTVSRRAMHSQRQVVLAEIAIAEGRPRDAMGAFRRSDVAADGLPVSSCVVCALPGLARAAARAGWADSSRAIWERYVTTASPQRLESDSWFLAMAYRELRRLYAEAGDLQKSADFDRRLADLWKNADSELQERLRQSR